MFVVRVEPDLAGLEVILVNDCTLDDSMEIARRVVASHPRGTVVRCLEHEENRGLSAARNTGISASVGDYLYFLDSDDYISANAIELLADAAVQKRPDFVIGNYEVTGARRWAPPLSLGTGFYEGNALVLSTYVQGKWYVMAWNKLVSRPLVLQHKLYFQRALYTRMIYGHLSWHVCLKVCMSSMRHLLLFHAAGFHHAGAVYA